MADIDSLEINKIRGKKRVNKKTVKGNAKTFKIPNPWEMFKFIVTAGVVTLLLIVVALAVGYFQLLNDSFNNYKLSIQDYQNSRYEKLDNRVINLERIMQSTNSAR
jgi:hypothetical protein